MRRLSSGAEDQRRMDSSTPTRRDRVRREEEETVDRPDRAVASMGQGGAIAPQSWALPPQSGLAPAAVVSLRLAMGQLPLEKCIKTKKIQ